MQPKLALLFLAFVGYGFAQDDSLSQVLQQNNLATLSSLLQSSGLMNTLSTMDSFTLFAPTNEAFSQLQTASPEIWNSLQNNETLSEVLLYHVVQGALPFSSFMDGDMIPTLLGPSLAISVAADNTTFLNEAGFVETDIQVSNVSVCVRVDTVRELFTSLIPF